MQLSAQESNLLKLMPQPSKVEVMQGKFKIEKDFTLAITGSTNERIYPYAGRVLRRLSGRTGLFFPQDYITSTSAKENAKLVVSISRPGKVVLGEDESYTLIISGSGVKLDAITDIGAMRGLETMLQLLSADETGYYFPEIKIEDKPRFKWRGIMIDAARHFMPVDVIKRNIDALAAVKMNVLHLHLSDNQGVRVESKLFPKLQQFASDGDYYTQEQIKDIVAYAGARGIRVYPEFDIPWHSTAWFAAYPELGSAQGPVKIERGWGVFDPVFNPTIEATYKFFEGFFGEMSALFPDEYFHIGGDEGTKKEWSANQSIQDFMKKNNIPDIQAMHNYFNVKILNILTGLNKKMIGWDEILQPGMPTNIVIQSWRGQKSLIESAKNGYMGILSSGYYIDLIQSAEFHYMNDPLPDTVKLSNEEKERILGGEATMWAELVTPENVDSRIWPRTMAIAERFWSPSSVKDVNSMYERMNAISYELEELGINHIKNQDMMLRRLTRNNCTKAVKTLIEYVEPVKIYTRHSQGVKYTSYSPYTRLVDAALPEAEKARKFRNAVHKFAETRDKNIKASLKEVLTCLQNNHKNFLQTVSLSPVLKEIVPLSENLYKLAGAGLKALNAVENGKELSSDERQELLKTVKEAKKPYGQVEIMITSAIEELINMTAKK
jgi:hexosaminidase